MGNFKIKISMYRILFLILIINPIFSLVFDGTTIYYHYIMLPIVYLLLGFMFFRKKQNAMHFFIISACVVVITMFAILLGADKGKLNNHLFNYLDMILLCIFFAGSDNLEKFKAYVNQHVKMIFGCVLIINIVETYLLVTKAGYQYQYSWGGTFFHGTSSMPHTLSYLMLTTVIYTIGLVLVTNRSWYAVFSLIPLYCIFESGARVSLVLAAVLGLILFDLVFSKKTKSTLLKWVKAGVIISICAYALRDQIVSSDLFAKILKRNASGNSSSGRLILWLDLLSRYFNTPSRWVLGFGDDKVYYYANLNTAVGVSIWAHNDFVQILFGKGIVGLLCYLSGVVSYIKTLFKRNGNYYSFLLMAFYFIASLVNGFYSYKDISLAIPFVFMINDLLSNRKKEVERKI